MPKLTFHPDIAIEVKESYIWYQNRALGLGDDFLSELESAYNAIIELTDTWPKFNKKFRRFILSKFPFSIIYKHENNLIIVLAVMHNSRKPNYWIDRTKSS